MTKLRAKEQIQKCEKEYERLKKRMCEVGFICEGSLVERWMRCGKPTCQCASDDAMKHGPYFQLSWKENGKTVSRRLSPQLAALYHQWIANRQYIEAILLQMHTVSRKAQRYLIGSTKPAKNTS